MRHLSVNSEMFRCLLALVLLGAWLVIPAESRASNRSTLEKMVEESLACHQKAVVLEVGLELLTKEEVIEQKPFLRAQVIHIEACAAKGNADLEKGRDGWREKVKRLNQGKRHSATHLREAALRSTIGKILKRTKKSLLKLRTYLTE